MKKGLFYLIMIVVIEILLSGCSKSKDEQLLKRRLIKLKNCGYVETI